jgi:hypothetical protein
MTSTNATSTKRDFDRDAKRIARLAQLLISRADCGDYRSIKSDRKSLGVMVENWPKPSVGVGQYKN